MSSNSNKNSWIVILPVAAAVAAYVIWVYLPGRKAIAELREQVRTKQDFVTESERSMRALRAGKLELTKTEAYLADCRVRAAEDKDLGDILSMIHASADHAKVRITRFDPLQTTNYERLRRVPVTVGLTGQFAQVHEFLQSLEEMPAYIWVGSAKLDLDVRNGKDVVGEINLVIFIGNSESSSYAVCSDKPI